MTISSHSLLLERETRGRRQQVINLLQLLSLLHSAVPNTHLLSFVQATIYSATTQRSYRNYNVFYSSYEGLRIPTISTTTYFAEIINYIGMKAK